MNDLAPNSDDPTSQDLPDEIDARKAPQEPPRPSEPAFDPLQTCPPDERSRYARRAALATEQPLKAIELKCLECCAWSRPEAARCEITGCPLWEMNRRVFGGTASRRARSGRRRQRRSLRSGRRGERPGRRRRPRSADRAGGQARGSPRSRPDNVGGPQAV
jgi:hypothetical protein